MTSLLLLLALRDYFSWTVVYPGTTYQCENLCFLITHVGFCSWQVQKDSNVALPSLLLADFSWAVEGAWGDELDELDSGNTQQVVYCCICA